jgi:hypothetical protein
MTFRAWQPLAACLLLLTGFGAVAADGIEKKTVQFAKGASSATVKGTLKGDQTIDYALRAKAGQTMTVTFKGSNGANYFNVLPPGSTGEAIFIGATEGNEFKGELPADGEYRIRVFLMRSAARRGEASSYTMTVGITGVPKAAAASAAPAGDAKVKGTPYHATGKVPCAAGNEAPGSQQCEFGVIRGKPGEAEVHVTIPGGLKRVLKFAGAKVSSEGAMSVKAAKSADTWSVDVNDYEHYRIPEAVISGG